MVRPLRELLFWTLEMSTLICAGRRSMPEMVNSRFVVFVLRSLIMCPKRPEWEGGYHWGYLTLIKFVFLFSLPLQCVLIQVFAHQVLVFWGFRIFDLILLSRDVVSPQGCVVQVTSAFFDDAFREHGLCWAIWHCRPSLDERLSSDPLWYLKLNIN